SFQRFLRRSVQGAFAGTRELSNFTQLTDAGEQPFLGSCCGVKQELQTLESDLQSPASGSAASIGAPVSELPPGPLSLSLFGVDESTWFVVPASCGVVGAGSFFVSSLHATAARPRVERLAASTARRFQFMVFITSPRRSRNGTWWPRFDLRNRRHRRGRRGSSRWRRRWPSTPSSSHTAPPAGTTPRARLPRCGARASRT